MLPRYQSVSSALDIEKPDSEASQAGQAEVVGQGFMVRQLFYLCTQLGIDKKNART